MDQVMLSDMMAPISQNASNRVMRERVGAVAALQGVVFFRILERGSPSSG